MVELDHSEVRQRLATADQGRGEGVPLGSLQCARSWPYLTNE